MKQEFTIIDEWLPFEIHPDTPQTGVLWKDYFPGMNPDLFFQQIDQRGKKMGIRFGPQPLMSNSRMAMEGGEFAKDHGRFDAYHEAVFKAFFTDCLDIGDRTVILDVARSAGLDTDALNAALDGVAYLPRLERTTYQAKTAGISSAPTFLIEGYGTVTGAQSFETFQSILRHVELKTNHDPITTLN